MQGTVRELGGGEGLWFARDWLSANLLKYKDSSRVLCHTQP